MQRRPRFGHATTEELYRYWDRRRGTRPAPDRTEIEPSDIRTILPDTFILEVDDTGRFSWRLAGTRVCAVHCRELKGRDFLSDWTGKERQTIQAVLDAIIRESAVGIIQFEGRSERDQNLSMEMVLLPLKVFGRTTCRVLGAIATMERPYWLGLYPPVVRRVAGLRMLWPSGQQGTEEAASFGRRSEPPPTVMAGLDQVRRYRHLMVVDGGKP